MLKFHFNTVNISDLLCDDDTSSSTPEPEQEDNDSELGTGDVDPEDTRVCGTDGNTYSSICQLLQQTVNVNVHYAGQCDSSHCRGGPVSSIVYILVVITTKHQFIAAEKLHK